ncbi:MAG: endonuclease/exonuclease/phosphatase family protein [Clostridia bacterium]|nr:endonuclease/exonuclease/phosphatase family protein [Clostridia bacterium]
MKIKFMTYNIASGNCFDGTKPEDGSKFKAHYDISRCCSVINEIKPDILGLNEINEHDTRFDSVSQPQVIAEKCDFPYYFFGKAVTFAWHPEGAYGNAKCSKFPYVSNEVIHIPDPPRKDEEQYYEHRNIIKSIIELPDKRRICHMQVHVGLAIQEHQNAIMTLCDLIDNTKEPIILSGDFNMREWDFLMDKIRERLIDVAQAMGEPYIKTFPSSHEFTNCPDVKIDYIFVSPSIKVLSHGTFQSTASDHLPYFAELEI